MQISRVDFGQSVRYRMSGQGRVDSRAIACEEEGGEGIFMQPCHTHVREPRLMAIQLILFHHSIQSCCLSPVLVTIDSLLGTPGDDEKENVEVR